MALYTQTYELRRWKGTLEEVARAIRLAATDLGGEDPPRFSLTAAFRGGQEVRLEDLAELDRFTERDPTDMTTLRASIIGRAGTAELVFRDSSVLPAVQATVNGSDESRAHGLAVRLKAELDRGSRALHWLSPSMTLPLVGVGVGLIIGTAPFLFQTDHLWSLVGTTAGTVLVLGMMATATILPPFELHRTGAALRVQRWGKWCLVAMTTLGTILGIAAFAR